MGRRLYKGLRLDGLGVYGFIRPRRVSWGFDLCEFAGCCRAYRASQACLLFYVWLESEVAARF